MQYCLLVWDCVSGPYLCHSFAGKTITVAILFEVPYCLLALALPVRDCVCDPYLSHNSAEGHAARYWHIETHRPHLPEVDSCICLKSTYLHVTNAKLHVARVLVA